MKRYLSIIYIVLLVITFQACSKDFLDKPPLTQIENDAYWKTANDLENYTIQFYSSLPAFNNVGRYTGLMSWDGTRGSDVQIAASPSTLWNGTQSPVTSGGNWTWGNIRDINIFFQNYTRCEDPFETYQHFLGEAHFFKAWFYYQKVRLYGDVPWFTDPLEMDSEELYKARDPRTTVVDSILAHLDRAIEYLDPLATVKGKNNRLSKQAALLFKSRVALFEGSWQKYHAGSDFGSPGADPARYFRQAVDAAETLMQPGYGMSLYSQGNFEDDYCKLFSLKDQLNTAEVILWKGYAINRSLSHSFQIYVSDRTAGISMTLEQIQHYLDRNGNPYDYLTLAKTVKGNAFLEQLQIDCDPRLSQTIWTPGALMWDNSFGRFIFTRPFLDKSGESLNNTGFQIRKGNDPYATLAGGGVSWSTNDETGAVIFRYAEALLNYAEAKAELGEVVDYHKSINLLRRRVGMPDFKVHADANSPQFADYGYAISDELREIRRERTVELGAEGFRFDDIRRWAAHKLLQRKRPKGYPLDRADWPGITINYRVDADGFLDPFVSQLPNGYGFKENRDYLECVPLNQLTLNPNLTQNPGWE